MDQVGINNNIRYNVENLNQMYKDLYNSVVSGKINRTEFQELADMTLKISSFKGVAEADGKLSPAERAEINNKIQTFQKKFDKYMQYNAKIDNDPSYIDTKYQKLYNKLFDYIKQNAISSERFVEIWNNMENNARTWAQQQLK